MRHTSSVFLNHLHSNDDLDCQQRKHFCIDTMELHIGKETEIETTIEKNVYLL